MTVRRAPAPPAGWLAAPGTEDPARNCAVALPGALPGGIALGIALRKRPGIPARGGAGHPADAAAMTPAQIRARSPSPVTYGGMV